MNSSFINRTYFVDFTKTQVMLAMPIITAAATELAVMAPAVTKITTRGTMVSPIIRVITIIIRTTNKQYV